MRRWSRRLLRVGAVLGVLVAILLVLKETVLPAVVRRAVRAELAAMGLPGADLEVRSISWHGAEAANLRLDAEGSARVAAVAVLYSPGSLLSGKVKRIEVTGAEVTLRLRDGEADLGALGRIKTSGGTGGAAELPFERIDVRSSALIIDWNGKRARIPLEGSVVNAGGGQAELDFRGSVQGAALHLSATLMSGEGRVLLAAEAQGLDLATLLAALPEGLVEFPLRAGGSARLNLLGEFSDHRTRATVNLAAREVWLEAAPAGVPVRAQGMSAELKADLQDGFSPPDVRARLTAETAQLGEVALRSVRLEAERVEDRLAFRGEAAGDRWRLKALTGSCPGVFGPANGEHLAEASWELEGQVPAMLAEALSEEGLDLSRLGAATVTGRATAEASLLRSLARLPPVNLADVRVILAPGEMRIAPADLALTGLSGDLRIAGQVDTEGLRLSVLPESRIALDGVSARGQALAVNKAAPAASAALLRPGQEGVEVWVPFLAGARPWAVRLHPMTVEFFRPTGRLGRSATIEGMAGVLALEGTIGGGRGEIALLPRSWLGFDSLVGPTARVGPARLDLRGTPGRPAAVCRFDEDGLTAHLACEAHAEREVSLAAGDLSMTLKTARLTAAARLGPTNTAQGTVEIEGAGFPLGSSGHALGLERATASIELKDDGRGEETIAATLALDGLSLSDRRSKVLFRFDKDALQPVSASLNLAKERGEFQLKWPLGKEGVLTAAGRLDLSRAGPAGAISVAWDGLRLDEDHALAKMLADATGLTVGGAFSVNGDLRLERGRILPRITVAADDASLSSREYQVQVQGITGAVTLTNFSPLATPGNQRLAVRSVEAGTFKLTNGLVAFRFEEDPAAIFIERTVWGFAGGRIYENGLRIGLADPELQFRFFADGLELQEVLRLAFGERVTGEGTLYGMIPVTINPSNLERIRFGQGFLYATPGTGWWKIPPARDQVALTVLEHAVKSTARTAEESRERDRIFAGLLDFEYNLFKIDFIRESEGLLGRVTAAGRSRDPNNPVQYGGLVLDVPRFDENLRRAIMMKRTVDRATERPRP